jgi:membrane-bound PQQ-dependent dehydrogenase (glucose/quinate/shikimate family)
MPQDLPGPVPIDSDRSRDGRPSRIAVRLVASLLAPIALVLTAGGGQLVLLGGSPYYLVAGLLIIAAAILLWRGDRRGVWIYAAMLAATLVWALWETGGDPWALAPRIIGPAIIGLLLLLPPVRRGYGAPPIHGGWFVGGGVLIVLLFACGAWLSQPVATDDAAPWPAAAPSSEWRQWGNGAGGDRFATAAQITPANVARLQPAWSFETGAKPRPGGAGALAFEATPIKIGNRLFLCSPHNVIFALDATSGRQLWRFDPQTKDMGHAFANCRGVAYHAFADPAAPCGERIYSATIDARLIAIDARTGARCRDFGRDGEVSLTDGIGNYASVLYYVTSTPVVSGNVVVTGSYGLDGQKMDQPSGVVRGYDLASGKPVWAFDPADPERGTPQARYAPGTPNMWSVASSDEKLGLVYLPFGVATPDFFGGRRSPGAERFSNAIVAVDNRTGRPRWTFQTVHHDLWDYDVASQPVLTDIRVGDRMVPALVSISKTGQSFILDRATGQPLSPVVEKPVPQGAAPGDWTAPTQPFSVDMPVFGAPPLTEATMWGLTPIDQLWCRIAFRKLRYDGAFTPPRQDWSIQYPGSAGGVNWGSVSIDRQRRIMIVNSTNMPTLNHLISAEEVRALGLGPMGTPGQTPSLERFRLGVPQTGAPYGAQNHMFLSPLGVPCIQPPFGTLSAVDLDSRALLWSRPIGMADSMGPLGIPSRLPFTIGLPTLGGSITTASGLTFIASTPDRRLRAIETATGRLLWQTRLPASANATPMTYVGNDGRQYLVIAAGGSAALASNERNVLVAYALPQISRR